MVNLNLNNPPPIQIIGRKGNPPPSDPNPHLKFPKPAKENKTINGSNRVTLPLCLSRKRKIKKPIFDFFFFFFCLKACRLLLLLRLVSEKPNPMESNSTVAKRNLSVSCAPSIYLYYTILVLNLS